MPDLLYASKFVCKLSTSFFTGAAIYCNLVEHPARLQCGTKLAASVFPSSFRRAATFQIVLSLTSTASAFGAFYLNRDKEWLFVGLAMSTILPYTLGKRSILNIFYYLISAVPNSVFHSLFDLQS